jgi:hypothetical protein
MAKPTLGQFARLAGSVAAARAVAADDPRAREAGRALDVRVSDGSVTIHQHRTSEQVTYAITVTGLPRSDGAGSNGNGSTWSPALISARIANPPVDVSLTEMTERQRHVVEDGIRHRLLETAFGPNASVLDARDSADVLANAVVDVVGAIGQGDTSLTRLNALLDLLEIERLHVPFDAQTRFYEKFLSDGRGPLDSAIAAVATRLGFAAEAT